MSGVKSPDIAASSSKPPESQKERLLVLSLSGDLTTKAEMTRRKMISRLVENLRTSIRESGRKGKVVQERNRLFVRLAPFEAGTHKAPATPGSHLDDDAMVERLARVFGVQSVSPAKMIKWTTPEEIVEAGFRLGEESVCGKTFRVRARRVGNRGKVPIHSVALERELGALLQPSSAGVNLTQPEVTVFVEVDPEKAYIFADKTPGQGGLPLGTAGRAVSLISGGFDSPVASWRLLRRGVELDYVFCNLGGRSHQLETLAIAKHLTDHWQCGSRPRFHALDFDPMSREIQARVKTRYWQVVLKRMMIRAAERIAMRLNASAIVTGEAIGQVSSQTLQNLAVISEGAAFPILRPLIGNNKQEIIAESRIVGTHDLSAKVGEYCAIVPKRPATHAVLRVIEQEEARLNPDVLEEALATRSEFRLTDIDLNAWDQEDLAATEVKAEETVIDLRSKAAFETWHYPGALYLDFAQAIRAYPSFDTAQNYVLYCEYGLKSAHLADLMRREGLSARHIAGGQREAQRWAE
ncbi:MAG: tRNA uracil 4-sulfurtransferase ThiI [Myxococcota bacterium]